MNIKYIGKNIVEDKDLNNWINENIKEKEVIVSNGWIDSHVHFYSGSKYKLDQSKIKKLKGIVAVIDAGSSGSDNIKEAIIDSKENNPIKTFFMINASPDGLTKNSSELNSFSFDKHKYLKSLKYSEVIGTKFRLSNQALQGDFDSYQKVFDLSIKERKPLMVHIGNSSEEIFKKLESLREGDIITHFSHGKNMDTINFLKKYNKNKFVLDIGFGNESFNIKNFKNLANEGIFFHTISTDLHNDSYKNKSVRIEEIMSLFLSLGTSLEQVVNSVTWNPYEKIICNNEWKNYNKTYTIFKIIKKERMFQDSDNNKLKIREKIVPLATIFENGEVKKW